MTDRRTSVRRMAAALSAGALLVAVPAFIGRAPARAASLSVVSGAPSNAGCTPGVAHPTITEAIGCAADGDTIDVGAGTFDEQVVISKNVAIVGAGAASTVIDGQGGTTLSAPGQVRVTALGDVTLSNLTVRNPGTNTVNGPRVAIEARGDGVNEATGTWTFTNLAIDGGGLASSYGFHCTGGTGVPTGDNAADIVLQGNTVAGVTANHLVIENCVGGLQVTGNTFTQGAAAAGSILFSMRYGGVESVDPQVISGNTFTGNGSFEAIAYVGAFLGNGTVGRFANIEISDNTIGNVVRGVGLTNATGSTLGAIDDVTISGNTFAGTGPAGATQGVRVRGLVSDVAITGNTISEFGAGIQLVALSGQTPTGTVVSGNRIVGNGVGLDAVDLPPAPLVDARHNWWGCNSGPGTPGCDGTTGPVDGDPWLVLAFQPAPAATVAFGGTTPFGATTVLDSDGGTPPAGVPGSPAVTFGATNGGVSAPSAPLSLGATPTVDFLADAGPGPAEVRVTLDNATITQAVQVTLPPGAGGGGASPPPPSGGTCPDGAPSAGFADVDADDVHAHAIDCLVSLGIVAGTTGTTFGPTSPVTRGQLATLVAGALAWAGVDLPAGPDAFDDDDGDVHEAAIDRLAAAGIVGGVGGRSFDPNAPVSRAQTATILVAAYELVTGEPLPAPPSGFTDIDGSVHASNIDRAVAAGIVNGTTSTTFDVAGSTSRAQLASMLLATLDALVGGRFTR